MFCISVSGDSVLRAVFNSSSSVCGSNGFMSRVSHIGGVVCFFGLYRLF